MEKRKISSRAGLSKVLFTLMVCMTLMMNVPYLGAQNSQVTVTGKSRGHDGSCDWCQYC